MMIEVRVLANQARAQINGLIAKVRELRASSAAASGGAGEFFGSRAANNLTKFGSRLQWAGRQLTYNFTLPLALAAGAATKWELANERARVSIAKVYGDINAPAKVLNAELAALNKSFEQLSNKYAVQQSEVLGVAAAWAQAGVSGVALAKSVDLTLQAMILGEMDSTKATQALISIQAQYGASTAELNTILAELNMVENQTGISLQGLIEGFQRAAGMARTVGVSSRELAALLAALTPAAGSAAQAGNALKTIFSRIVAPTKQASDVIKLMHINVNDLAWKTANGTERLKIMARSFTGLSNNQQAFVSSIIASRYQVNRFNVLMRELAPGATGYYRKAIDSTANQLDIFRQKQKELNQVLQSNPQRLKQIGVILQNSLADIIAPLIPLLINLASTIAHVVQWFGNLSPNIQRVVGFFLLFVAVLGPIAQYLGAISTGLGLLARAFIHVSLAAFWAARVFASLVAVPFGLIATGIGRVIGAMVSLSTAMVGLISSGIAWFWTSVWLPAVARATALATAAFEAFVARSLAIWMATMNAVPELAAGAGRATVVVWEATSAATVGVFTRLTAMIRGLWLATIAFITSPGLILGRLGGLFVAIRTLAIGGLGAIVGFLTSIPGLIILAIVAAVVLFHNQIAGVFNNLVSYFQNLPSSIASNFNPIIDFFRRAVAFIQKAFYSLPNAVQNAFRAVLAVIAASARAIYTLFSYLNPFARHSPSLVDNTKRGMKAVGDQHQSASERIQQHVGAAAGAVQQFGSSTAGFTSHQDAIQSAQDRKQISSVSPGALASYDRMEKLLKVLKVDLAAVNTAMVRQQAVVDGLKNKLDAANDALKVQQDRLDVLKKIEDDWSSRLDAAQQKLQDWAQTPIQGMKAMNDAIFANDEAQKRLQLELLKMGQAGQGIDEITSKLDALNGQQELLRGTQADLRMAGAGSDILGPIGDQISLLDSQKQALQDQLKPIKDLQSELDRLATEGQILDLTNSLQFDPLKKQIDEAANSMQELPFDQILAGVRSSQGQITVLTDKFNQASAAVARQQAVVDRLTAARDKIQASYDAESAKLDKLKDQYDKINSAIQSITSAINDMTSAVEKAAQAKAAASAGGIGAATAAQFAAGAGGNLPDVGGTGSALRTDWKSQVPDIEAFTKGIADDVANMFGSFDLFKPIRDKWNAFTSWWSSTISPAVGVIGDGISSAVGSVNWGGAFKPISEWWSNTWNGISEVANNIWDLVGQNVIDVFKRLGQGIVDIVQPAWNEIKSWGDIFGPFLEAIGHLWNVIEPILRVLGIVLLAAWKIIWSVLADVIGPIFSAIGQVIGGALRIIHGIIMVILSLINGDWSAVWGGILDIVTGIWEAIWGVISNAGKLLWGLVAGIVQGIVGFFEWLWNMLVGNSIIPDMVNAIIAAFQFMLAMVAPIWNVWMAIIRVVAGVVMWLWKTIIQPAFQGIAAVIGIYITYAIAIFRGFWGNVQAYAALIWGILVRLGGFFIGLWVNYVRVAFELIKGGFSAVWTRGSEIVGYLISRFGDLINFVKGLPGRISSAVVGMWDGIKTGFRNAINAVIDWWNGLHFSIPRIDVGPVHVGGGTIDFPNVPRLAHGGLTTGPSLAGEGKFAEYVIPTDPAYRKQALTLLNNANAALYRSGASHIARASRAAGARGAGGLAGHPVTVTDRSTTNFHFHGNLEFPNVKGGQDAEDFIRNLESLARGA